MYTPIEVINGKQTICLIIFSDVVVDSLQFNE